MVGAEILFCDENLLILNKQCGIAVIPARGEVPAQSLLFCAERHIGGKLFVVHRIDRDTSGVVVFCRNPETHRLLNGQFEKRIIGKDYYAVVDGTLCGEKVIDKPIREFGSGRMGVHEKGKPSRTDFRVLESFANATYLGVVPHTGRRHQIRVHLYHEGHPVMGDRLYGKERPVGGVERMMLHAASISFLYPGGERFSIGAPVDNLWTAVVERLRTADADAGNVCRP